MDIDTYQPDWLRTKAWDLWYEDHLVETLEDLRKVISIPLEDFLDLPSARAMPDKLRAEIFDAAVKHLQGQHDQLAHGRGGQYSQPVDSIYNLHEDETAKAFIARGDNVHDLGTRARAKIDIVKEISGRLLADPTARKEIARRILNVSVDAGDISSEDIDRVLSSPQELARYVSDRQIRVASEDAVQQVLDGWASTSTDDSAHAIALQRIAAKEFGVSIGNLERNLPKSWKAADEVIHTDGALMGRVLRHMYKHTQEELVKAGIKEVTLSRGLHIEEKHVPKELSAPEALGIRRRENTVHTVSNPISSYSVSLQLAERFARNIKNWDEIPVILVGRIPASRILSTARTGVGCLNEYEFVVLGGKGKLRGVAIF